MPIITISRQFGAAGRPIGEALAERFGAELLDREIVALVAERAGIPEQEAEGYDEQLPGLWQRIAAALAAGSPDPAIPPLPVEMLPATAVHERLARLTRAVIEEAAARGNCVILGRGGAFIVGRRPDALHVQLHATLEARVRYLLLRFEEIPADTRPDEVSLQELCRTMDGRRSSYIRRLFGVDWLDPNNYDLSIDTGRVDIPTAVDLIELASRRRVTGAAMTEPADASALEQPSPAAVDPPPEEGSAPA
jgi:cytidylate kinase